MRAWRLRQYVAALRAQHSSSGAACQQAGHLPQTSARQSRHHIQICSRPPPTTPWRYVLLDGNSTHVQASDTHTHSTHTLHTRHQTHQVQDGIR